MQNNNFPETVSIHQCKQVLQEYAPLALGKSSMSMWRALSLMPLYGNSCKDIPFELFHAYDANELNLQVQWKIASCYHAVSQGTMSMSEALSLIDTIEWAGQEWAFELEDDESQWPVVIILMEEDTMS
jgi:hypothetical protein